MKESVQNVGETGIEGEGERTVKVVWKICAHCGKPFQGRLKRIVCDECLQEYWSRKPKVQ